MADLLEQLQRCLADRYRLERELGRGGMAAVYLAHDLRHDRPVALKLLHPELSSALGPERFLQEIKLTARLDHPHILPVLDSGETNGQLWYTMPWVQGETLRRRLAREVQLPLGEAVRIAQELADALDHAHRHGVIHRDIKPENILLSEGHARVADFGVARALETAGEERLTATGLTLGTPAYMAPEQAAGDRVDGRADIYAIGCVLYEMLAGEPPFTGPTPQAIIAKRFAGPPAAVRTTRPDVPPGLEAILNKALAQVPAARFASAGDLRQALAHAPLEPAGAAPVATRYARPGILRLLGVAMIPLALILGGIVLARARTGETRDSAPAPKLLAVLPFESAGDTSERAFADGMTEEIASRLARVPGLGLVARSSALQYRQSGKSAPAFGRTLGVDYVLDGTVRWAFGPAGEKQVRITPELIRVADGTRVWGEPYQRVLTDVFLLQADVAQEVAEALHGKLGRGEERAVRTAPTTDPEAFRLYALGRAEWRRRTPEGIERAADYFRQAILRDSSFARAWAGLADAYGLYDIRGVRTLPRDTAYARAKAAALRAIALDSMLAEPYASLNQILRYGYWDWAGSERAIRQAIALDPTYATARQWFAEHLLNFGRMTEAIAEARKAMQFDPLAPATNNVLGLALQFAGRFDESIAVLRASVSRDVTVGLGPQTLFWTYLLAGREQDALELREWIGDTSSFWLAVARARSDPRARATVLEALARPGSRDAVGSASWASRLYSYLGARELALAELERALAERDPAIEFIKVDPLFTPLRGEPRFKAVVARMGLPP